MTDITAPVATEALDTEAATSTANVTLGTVTWNPTTTPAAYATQYTATVIATAATNYSFTDTATATVNGQTATVTKNQDGTLSISYTFEKTALTPVTITATDKEAAWSADGIAVPVNGMFTITEGAGAATYSVTNGTGKGTYDAQTGKLTVTKCGTFTVKVSTAVTETYAAGAETSATLTVNKIDPTAPTGLTATYGQTLANVTLPDGWTWADSTQSVGNVVDPAATFKANYAGDDNHNAASNVDVAVTVSKADAVAATVTANNRTYDGTEKPLVTVTGEASGGTMYYELGTDAENAPSGMGADTSIPTATNAGTYYVWHKAVGDEDHFDSAPACVTVTINSASVTLIAINGTAKYDGTVKSVSGFTSSVRGLRFSGVSAGGSGTNVGSYAVTFTGVTVNTTTDSTGNYVVTGLANGRLTINPASVTLKANDATETYDGTAKTVTGFTSSVEGLSFTGVSAGGSGTDAGSYAVTFSGVKVNATRDSTGNYVVTSTTNGTLTICKAKSSVTTAPTAKELICTGSAQELVNAGTAGGGTMQYALGTNAATAPTSGWTASIPTGTNAGTYYVWYKVVGDANHDDSAAACVTVSISAVPFGPPTFKLPMNTRIVEESAFEGLPMTVVEIPDGCESIGANAFKDCANLTQIRIPASVATIDETAFDGCTDVLVFGTSPSAAETFCSTHLNCTFIAENQGA